MALAEKHVADALVDWRGQQHTGTEYIRIDEAIGVAADALAALQTSRAQMARMAELVEALSKADA